MLCLELSDPGVDHTVLSEFRTQLIREQAERLIFEKLLNWCQNQGWLKPRSCQRTDSTHVLASIRAITRLECVGETLRAALNALAVVAPSWLKSQSQPEWIERYSDRIEDYHLPVSKAEREQQALLYGQDGMELLDAIFARSSPDWLRQVPAVETLRQVWVQQYYVCHGKLYWRTEEGIPPSSIMISSHYDLDTHYARKDTAALVGYKVHLSETCEPDCIDLITNVETTVAPITDGDVMECIHTSLTKRDLLPSKHIVDTGYLDADLLVGSQTQHQVELLGPTRLNYRWQFKEGKDLQRTTLWLIGTRRL